MKSTILLLIACFLISCHTAKINNQSQKMNPQHIELGVIGSEQTHLTTTVFETVTVPILNQKIRVQVQSTPFSKTTHKAYTKALIGKNSNDTIKYIDTVAIKPNFISLNLLDQIAYINELNQPDNSSVINYLKNMENMGVITSISAAFNKQHLAQLQQAEEIYLVNKKHRKYELELINNSKTVHTIEFSNAVIFGYQLSNFCWAKSEKQKFVIANLLSKNSKCQRATHKNPQKLVKKVNHFKFSSN